MNRCDAFAEIRGCRPVDLSSSCVDARLQRFFDMVFPSLNPGGVFVAHNGNKKRMEPLLRRSRAPSLFPRSSRVRRRHVSVQDR